MNRTLLLLLPIVLFTSGCAKKETSSTASQPAQVEDPVATHPVTPAFAGKTWKVTKSSAGATGATYVFKEDGTLVVESPGATRMEGKWSWSEGALTMVEEGISYPTDILALDDSTFRIRSNNPGEPVELTMTRVP
jgi:hypothetical protein